ATRATRSSPPRSTISAAGELVIRSGGRNDGRVTQLGLFTDAAARPLPSFEADAQLAARLPDWILPGPSTWTFPGWEGVVYPTGVTREELLERGLGWAARFPLFRAVGIDRSYYAPLEEAELAHYAAELPDGYPCVMKAWSAITTLADPRTGAPNPGFLDAG